VKKRLLKSVEILEFCDNAPKTQATSATFAEQTL